MNINQSNDAKKCLIEEVREKGGVGVGRGETLDILHL